VKINVSFSSLSSCYQIFAFSFQKILDTAAHPRKLVWAHWFWENRHPFALQEAQADISASLFYKRNDRENKSTQGSSQKLKWRKKIS
jgi:hypothetical protein